MPATKCVHCGLFHADTADRCPHCGKDRFGRTFADAPPPPSIADEGAPVIGFLLGFFLGLWGLIGAFVFARSATKRGAVWGFVIRSVIVAVGVVAALTMRPSVHGSDPPAPVGNVAMPAVAPPRAASPAEVEAALKDACALETDGCVCLRAEYAKAAARFAADVEASLTSARETCEAKNPVIRAGVISTCTDGNDADRDVCTCAADAFLSRATVAQLNALHASGWTSELLALLHDARATCAPPPGGKHATHH